MDTSRADVVSGVKALTIQLNNEYPGPELGALLEHISHYPNCEKTVVSRLRYLNDSGKVLTRFSLRVFVRLWMYSWLDREEMGSDLYYTYGCFTRNFGNVKVPLELLMSIVRDLGWHSTFAAVLMEEMPKNTFIRALSRVCRAAPPNTAFEILLVVLDSFTKYQSEYTDSSSSLSSPNGLKLADLGTVFGFMLMRLSESESESVSDGMGYDLHETALNILSRIELVLFIYHIKFNHICTVTTSEEVEEVGDDAKIAPLLSQVNELRSRIKISANATEIGENVTQISLPPCSCHIHILLPSRSIVDGFSFLQADFSIKCEQDAMMGVAALHLCPKPFPFYSPYGKSTFKTVYTAYLNAALPMQVYFRHVFHNPLQSSSSLESVTKYAAYVLNFKFLTDQGDGDGKGDMNISVLLNSVTENTVNDDRWIQCVVGWLLLDPERILKRIVCEAVKNKGHSSLFSRLLYKLGCGVDVMLKSILYDTVISSVNGAEDLICGLIEPSKAKAHDHEYCEVCVELCDAAGDLLLNPIQLVNQVLLPKLAQLSLGLGLDHNRTLSLSVLKIFRNVAKVWLPSSPSTVCTVCNASPWLCSTNVASAVGSVIGVLRAEGEFIFLDQYIQVLRDILSSMPTSLPLPLHSCMDDCDWETKAMVSVVEVGIGIEIEMNGNGGLGLSSFGLDEMPSWTRHLVLSDSAFSVDDDEYSILKQMTGNAGDEADDELLIGTMWLLQWFRSAGSLLPQDTQQTLLKNYSTVVAAKCKYITPDSLSKALVYVMVSSTIREISWLLTTCVPSLLSVLIPNDVCNVSASTSICYRQLHHHECDIRSASASMNVSILIDSLSLIYELKKELENEEEEDESNKRRIAKCILSSIRILCQSQSQSTNQGEGVVLCRALSLVCTLTTSDLFEASEVFALAMSIASELADTGTKMNGDGELCLCLCKECFIADCTHFSMARKESLFTLLHL